MITVSHTFQNIDGTAASGTVVFRLSDRITNGGISYDPAVPMHSTLNSSGQLSVTLPANNDPGTTPANTYYEVALMLNGSASGGVGDSVMVLLPYNAPGGTIDLGTLLPQTSGDGV
jgi:hypothetical protein